MSTSPQHTTRTWGPFGHSKYWTDRVHRMVIQVRRNCRTHKCEQRSQSSRRRWCCWLAWHLGRRWKGGIDTYKKRITNTQVKRVHKSQEDTGQAEEALRGRKKSMSRNDEGKDWVWTYTPPSTPSPWRPLPRFCQPSFLSNLSAETSAHLRTPPQTSANLRKPPQTSANLRRVLQTSAKFSEDLHATLRKSPQTSANLRKVLQTFANLSEDLHATLSPNLPTNLHITRPFSFTVETTTNAHYSRQTHISDTECSTLNPISWSPESAPSMDPENILVKTASGL